MWRSQGPGKAAQQEGLGFAFLLLKRSVREESRDTKRNGERKRDGRFTDQEREKEIKTERIGRER